MKIGKIKRKPLRLIRAASQIAFFIFLPALYVSAFSGIKEIYLSIYQHRFNAAALLPQIVEIVAIVPVTILLGRFFCGWMCAFGAMGDFISMLSHKLLKRKWKISERADRLLKFAKYLWLIILVAAVWSFGSKALSASNPWDAFGMLLTPGSPPNLPYVAAHLAPALLLLLLIIGASFFVDRFFCRYLCPLGAIFSVVSKPRITSIRKPRAGCGKCRVCTNSCPMGIALYRQDVSKSGECITCFECTGACPRKNIRVGCSQGDIRPALAGTMAVAVMAGVYYAGSFETNALTANAAAVSQTSAGSQASAASSSSAAAGSGAAETPQAAASASSAASSTAPAASASQYKDGTYQGSGSGYRGGTTTVSVTVSSGKITDISVVSTGDTPQFFERAYSVVTQSIISSQTAGVDAVSGATYSSNGIMQAVAAALGKAEA